MSVPLHVATDGYLGTTNPRPLTPASEGFLQLILVGEDEGLEWSFAVNRLHFSTGPLRLHYSERDRDHEFS